MMTDKPTAPKASANYIAPALFGGAVIFMTFGVAGGWAAIAPLDSAVLAPGVVTVENNRRSVQHLEGGIIAEINVTDGQKVRAGDVLFRLDTTRAQAGEAVERLQLYAGRILEARLLAERHDLNEVSIPNDILELRGTPAIDEAIADQVSQFRERKLSIDGQVEILETRIQQSRTRIEGFETELSSTREQIGFINEELKGVRDLFEKGLVSSARLHSLERERARLEGVIGRTTAEISGTQSAIGEAELQIGQLRQERLERAAEQITEVRKTINELKERLTVSSDILRRTAIVAPRSGTVIGLKVFTIGQVIRAGDILLEIVPEDEGLVINAQVSPIDIDSVHAEMSAEVRFSSFKSRDIPVIYGTVREVSADRLVDENTHQPYFLARVTVTEEDIPLNLRGKLVPGMPSDVILPTGERTVLEYLINPLQSALAQAFTEE